VSLRSLVLAVIGELRWPRWYSTPSPVRVGR
jgi:hypothetical protein